MYKKTRIPLDFLINMTYNVLAPREECKGELSWEELYMNIIGMLKPKYSTTYLQAEDSLREGLYIMKESGYTAVPVIDEEGKYVGTVTEGDFLWHILNQGEEILDSLKVREIIKQGWNLASTDEEAEGDLINRALQQNFVPMVDDRNCYIGIITRRDIIQNILQKKIDSRYIYLPGEADVLTK